MASGKDSKSLPPSFPSLPPTGFPLPTPPHAIPLVINDYLLAVDELISLKPVEADTLSNNNKPPHQILSTLWLMPVTLSLIPSDISFAISYTQCYLNLPDNHSIPCVISHYLVTSATSCTYYVLVGQCYLNFAIRF